MTFDETEHHPRCDADGDSTKPCECHVRCIRDLHARVRTLEAALRAVINDEEGSPVWTDATTAAAKLLGDDV